MSILRARIAPIPTAPRWALLGALLVCPSVTVAQSGAADDRLAGEAGLDRARVLYELTDELRADEPDRALEYGREALGILRDLPSPNLRADVLAEMAWAEMTLGNYDEAERLGRRARDIAAGANYLRGQARAINNLGVIARRRGDPARAVELFNRSLAIQQQRGDEAAIAMALNNLGFVYSTDLGDFEQSLQHHIQAMEIRSRLDRPADLALSLNNIGVLYTAMGEYDRALDYLERALALRRRHDTPLRAAGTLSNIGEVYLAEGDASAALDRFRTALELRSQAGARSLVAAAQINIGHALTQLGRYADAEASLERALTTAEELREGRTLARAHERFGQLESARGRHDRAAGHFRQALEAAEGMGARHLVAEIWGLVADNREAVGDYRGALDAHRTFKELSDRNVTENKALRVATLEALYQAERREREIESLRHQQTVQDLEFERQRLIRNALAILALALLLGGSIYFRWRHTRTQAQAQKLERAARTDPLTRLDNRRSFLEKARLEHARMRRSGRPTSLILADIDRFKSLNDRHGHAVGDRVLREVADILKATVRKLDVVARWGGEEFVLLLPETDAEGAVVLANKIRRALAESGFDVNGDVEHLTITFGVTQADTATEVEDWIDQADRAMYAGKRAGRDRIVVADEATRATT